MSNWTNEELNEFDKAPTLQNKPLNDDGATFEEENPVWEVVANDKLYIRGAKGTQDTKWYITGVKNGGQVGLNGKNYNVKYVPVKDKSEIDAVTAAFNKKYEGQYPIDLMVSDKVALATVELVKQQNIF